VRHVSIEERERQVQGDMPEQPPAA
jgi:hypothetical protein